MYPTILQEDEHILVCVKPVGLAVQTARPAQQDCVSILKNHISRQSPGSAPYLAVVHRLDQPVSGVLVFAKTKQAAADLSHQLGQGIAHKEYYALCAGVPEEKQGELIHRLGKDPVSGKAVVFPADDEKGKQARLIYEVIEEKAGCGLLRIQLLTGRFHQIRAQLSAAGHPLLGDFKYGNAESVSLSKERSLCHPALCARRLVFTHPATGKTMEITMPKEDTPGWLSE